MTAQLDTTSAPACVTTKDLFQDPLVEDPPTSSAPVATRRRYDGMVRRAESICSSCPLMQTCLYDAVVKYDVDGFCGGTTRKQRNEMRNLLAVSVSPEDLDTLAGVTARHRQVDHDEVVRLRNANPHESLEMLAHRLGCSLSTVKRHLRKARNQAKVTPIRKNQRPTVDQVMEAFRRVKGITSTAVRAA